MNINSMRAQGPWKPVKGPFTLLLRYFKLFYYSGKGKNPSPGTISAGVNL